MIHFTEGDPDNRHDDVIAASSETKPMKSLLGRGIGILAWGLAVFGTLQIHSIPGDFTHDLCGRWG